MKKPITLVVSIALLTMLMSGCTTWNGISKTEKPGTYYVIKNKNLGILGVHNGALLCDAQANGDLACKEVQIESK